MNRTGRQRRRSWGWRMILILFVLALAVVVRMPASVLAEILESRCARRCLLAVPQGNWWNGSGRLFLRSAADAAWYDLGEIRWGPERVLSGLWRIDLAGGSVRVSLHPTGVAVRGENLMLEKALHFPLIWPGLPGSGWSGRVGIRQGRWDIALGGRWTSEGEIEGRELFLDLLSGQGLSPIAAKWAVDSENGGRLSFASRDADSLRLAGEVMLARGGKARAIDAWIDVTPETSPELKHLVAGIAVADAASPGHYRIVQSFE